MAKFDLNAVKPESAEFPTAAAHKENPAREWLRDSYESDEARQVVVPASQVRSVVNLLHNAARELSVGCAVRLGWDGKVHTVSKETWEAVKVMNGQKNVTVMFKGKERSERPRKGSATPTE